MNKHAAKRQVKAESAAVRDILLAWDPIGTGGAPKDEYDCLVDHIVSAAHQGKTGTKDIAAVIASELEDHFGVTVSEDSILKVAGQVAAQLKDSQT
ncbi:MAG: hypothetical protein ACKVS6_00795 [Planctomycetota bacterium]